MFYVGLTDKKPQSLICPSSSYPHSSKRYGYPQLAISRTQSAWNSATVDACGTE